MNLNTERLILSEISINDLGDIHELHSLSEVDKYNTSGIPDNSEITRLLVSGWVDSQNELPTNKYVFNIRNNENEFIGLVGITIGKPNYKNAEIWYKLHPAHWNKGYATEVVKTILYFCFVELQLHRITAGCATTNAASIKVLEKTGFTREGFHKKILPIRGEWVDNFEYAILEEDFLSNKN